MADAIDTLIKLLENPRLAFDIINDFTQACLSQNKPIQDSKNPENDIQSVILAALRIDVVKQNPNSSSRIIDGFTQACLLQSKIILDIQPVISEAIKQDPNLALEIIYGFTRACLLQGKLISEIQPTILQAIEQNPNFSFMIINAFTQACLSQNKPIQDSKNPENDIQSVILTAIKQKSDLAFSIINAFTQICLVKGKIQELITVFQNLLEEIQKLEFSAGNKSLLINQIKSIAILILSQYLQDTLLTLKDESSLSKKDRDATIESKLLGLFKTLYSKVFKEDIKRFEDIKLKDLIPIWQIYFVSKIKTQTINSGCFREVLPFIFDIFKDQDLTISQFIEQTKTLLQNFYYIDLRNKNGKEQLKKIKEESEKPENKDKPFIINTDFPKHTVISIIQNGQISIIDSSRVIFHPSYPQHQQILRDCGFEIDDEKKEKQYFNIKPYQENDTCYLNATLAFKCAMAEFLSQQKDKKPEDAPNTPNSILDGLKQQTDIQLKSILSIPSQYRKANMQQIVADVVSQLAEFYETLQQPITERYIADVKVLEKDASAKPLTPKEEYTDPEKTTSSSSLTSEEAVADIEKEELQRELGLGTITKNELAIESPIIATIMDHPSSATEFDRLSRIFGEISEVQKNVAVIQEARQEAAKSQPTTRLLSI